MAWKYNPFTGELSYYKEASVPPVGNLKIVNWYVDNDTGNLVVEYEDNA